MGAAADKYKMRKLEDILDLPPMESFETTDEDEAEVVKNVATVVEGSLITTDEKIEHALTVVDDLTLHNQEMDEIAETALEAYNELKDYGMNSMDVHAGKILEVASQMLKTALDARNSKADRKLKTVDLQLKKLRIDKQSPSGDSDPAESKFDRNDLLKALVNKPPAK